MIVTTSQCIGMDIPVQVYRTGYVRWNIGSVVSATGKLIPINTTDIIAAKRGGCVMSVTAGVVNGARNVYAKPSLDAPLLLPKKERGSFHSQIR